MANLNFTSVALGGRLTADPELKTTPSNVSVTSFRVAVNNPGKDAGASFFDVVAWRGTAEFITRYFRRGSGICIVGHLVQRSWQDRDGNKRSTTEIIADSAHFVDSVSEAGERQADAMDKARDDPPKFEELDVNDEMPF